MFWNIYTSITYLFKLICQQTSIFYSDFSYTPSAVYICVSELVIVGLDNGLSFILTKPIILTNRDFSLITFQEQSSMKKCIVVWRWRHVSSVRTFPFQVCDRQSTVKLKISAVDILVKSYIACGFSITSHYLDQCWLLRNLNQNTFLCISGMNLNYSDVIMGAEAFQITSLMIVYSAVYSDADKRKHQSSASLAFVRGLHRVPVNSPHKWPVTRKTFPFDDVIMVSVASNASVIFLKPSCSCSEAYTITLRVEMAVEIPEIFFFKWKG